MRTRAPCWPPSPALWSRVCHPRPPPAPAPRLLEVALSASPSLTAFITSMLLNISFDLWIGLHDAKKEFQWVEGEPLRHVSWAPGEPSECSSSSPGDKPVRPHCPIASPGPGLERGWGTHHPDKVSACCPTMRDGLKVARCWLGSLRVEQGLVLQFVVSRGWGLCGVVGHRLGAILIL